MPKSPIIGASKPHHIDDAIGAREVELDAEEPYRPKTVQGHE